jgi:glycosyltransferase involved in cell wall biosynthesis
MRVVFLITGSGGSFYCSNCYRDMLYMKAMRKADGITASAIPLYLPPDSSVEDQGFDSHVFFGAISMYLREKVPIFRKAPDFLDKLFDSGPMLRIAARQAGTTRTDGLEELTLNMIRGDNTFREHEVNRLVNYLVAGGKPDIIHLSNALIIGLARQLRKRADVRIVCSILNEDDWIEEMKEPYRTNSWKMIAAEAENVDAFVTPSSYFRELFISKTGLSGKNIHVVPIGIDPGATSQDPVNVNRPSIGYLCRFNRMNGFDRIVDSFIQLKSEKRIDALSLHICGGFTGDDKPFVSEQLGKIRKRGYMDSLKIHHDFQAFGKRRFFESISLLSVPVRKYDGYGLYILEANAAGVPVIQPSTGAFPEIVSGTQGGIIYDPDSVDELSNTLYRVLADPDLRAGLGRAGRKNVVEKYSLDSMSNNLLEVYLKLA